MISISEVRRTRIELRAVSGMTEELTFSAQRVAAIVTMPKNAKPPKRGCTVPLNIWPTRPPRMAPAVVETKPVMAVAVPARLPIGSRLMAVKLVAITANIISTIVKMP